MEKHDDVDDEEEGTAKTQQESCDEEEIVAAVVEEEPKKKEGTIRTRRGVQRKSTGDSEQLGLMLYGLANASRDTASESSDVPSEISLSSSASTNEPRRRGRRKATATVDDSENVDDSTNNDGN
jgi:hypothetical protein